MRKIQKNITRAVTGIITVMTIWLLYVQWRSIDTLSQVYLDAQNIDYDQMEDLVRNWQKPMVNKVFLVGESESCNENDEANGPSTLFQMQYMGVKYARNDKGERVGLKSKQKDISVELGVYAGKKICGQHTVEGETPQYLKVRHPDKNSEECPEGTVLCSDKPKVENRVCVEHKEACPITEIKFIDKDGSSTDTELHKFIPFTDKIDIRTSIHTDNLPLVDFNVNFDTPCLDHKSIYSFKDLHDFDHSGLDDTKLEGFVRGWVKYRTGNEFDAHENGCLKMTASGKFKDQRYKSSIDREIAKSLSMQLSQIEEANGITKLKTEKSLDYQYPKDLQDSVARFYSRHALGMNSEECDVSPAGKQKIFDHITQNTQVTDDKFQSINDQMTAMFVFQLLVVLTIFLLMFGNCICLCKV